MDTNGKTPASENGKAKRLQDKAQEKILPKTREKNARRGAPPKAAVTQATVTHAELAQLLEALHAAGRDDFTARLPVDDLGVVSSLASAFNRVASMNEAMVR